MTQIMKYGWKINLLNLKNLKEYMSHSFPYAGAVLNFSIKGLKYETTNMRLVPNRVQASSNEFCDSEYCNCNL